VEHVETGSKLSIKLKIVILLLILGLVILIIDMFKKETYRLVYGEYPKPVKAKGRSREEPKKEARRGEEGKSKKEGRRKGRGRRGLPSV
jgi:flagellar basal body-associated protein FliL